MGSLGPYVNSESCRIEKQASAGRECFSVPVFGGNPSSFLPQGREVIGARIRRATYRTVRDRSGEGRIVLIHNREEGPALATVARAETAFLDCDAFVARIQLEVPIANAASAGARHQPQGGRQCAAGSQSQ